MTDDLKSESGAPQRLAPCTYVVLDREIRFVAILDKTHIL
jgi:hypothetical protein